MMKATSFFFFLLLSFAASAQQPENWTQEQLLEPARLAATLNSGKKIPVIYSVGPGALIPHSVEIGMGNEPENIDKLRKQLGKLPKKKEIVIYCGCCPFAHCPNVRPALALLQEMKFTNYRLLNLPQNIRKDWIDKGYPTVNK